MTFSFFIQEYYPLFLQGAYVSLQIAFFASFLGIFLGFLCGCLLTLRLKFLHKIIWLYVTIIRGTPMLIQVTATYYLLKYAGVPISAYWSAVLSIGLNSGAYMSQVVLSGINSVSVGQKEAAKTLGFSTKQIMMLIVLPQAVRTILPSLGNEFITLIKDSSLASVIGVVELNKQGSIIISETYNIPAVYITLCIVYLMLTSIVSLIVLGLEKKFSYHVKN